MSKIVVIGAGITGITTAYSLAKRGHQVTIIESEPYAGMKTSYANGGQLSVSNSEVWTTYSNVAKAAKWIFKKDAPLLIKPYPSFEKLSWMLQFLFNTVSLKYESNTVKTIEMGLRARELYFAIAAEENIDFDLTKEGILHFYKNNKYYESAKKACALYQAHGVDRHIISTTEMTVIEPALANSTGIIGATYTEKDANGDIHKFCVNLAKVLETKYQVNFVYNTTVKKIERKLDSIFVLTGNDCIYEANDVVICAGVNSRHLGFTGLPIYPIKGYSITIDLETESEQNSAPITSLLDDEAKIVSSRLGNRFRVAGTAELADYNYDIRKDRVDPLINWVRSNFPGIRTEHCVPWAGLRPMTPSMLPIVGPSKTKNVWFNTGHGHLGWTLSAATAEMISDMIDQGPK